MLKHTHTVYSNSFSLSSESSLWSLATRNKERINQELSTAEFCKSVSWCSLWRILIVYLILFYQNHLVLKKPGRYGMGKGKIFKTVYVVEVMSL